MEEYDYLDSQDFENIIDFAVFIIEYFKNDYLVIRDFLFKDSPWDILIQWEIGLTHSELIDFDTYSDNEKKELSYQELIKKKVHLISIIYSTYYNCVLSNLPKSNDDEYVEAPALDKTLYEIVLSEKNQASIMLKNDLFAIKLLKFFVEAIEKKLGYSIKSSTYNKYKYELKDVYNLWQKEFKKRNMENIIKNYESNGLLQDEFLIISFNKNITEQVKNYISNNFRSKEEVFDFVNYLFTLAYSYLIKMRESGEEIVEIEEDIIDLVESSANLTKVFFSNFNIASQILETVFDSMTEYGTKYDLRHELKDEKNKEIIRDLDEHYDDKFQPEYMLHTYTLDDKLKYMINFLLEKYGYTDFMSLLLDEKEIYDLLFSFGLDARNSSFYKIEMIKKIISDVFEFLEYKLTMVNNEEDRKHYEEIIQLKTDNSSIISYFVNNYLYLFEVYTEYNNCSTYIFEKALFKNFKVGNILKLDKIFSYSFNRYIEIACGDIVELESVDYLNNLLKIIKSSGALVLNGGAEGNDRLFRSICLNLYERLVTAEITDINTKKLVNEIIHLIETTDDFSNLFIDNPSLCISIINLFVQLNHEYISNGEEFMYRRKITDEKQIKVLKKLNKYEENK